MKIGNIEFEKGIFLAPMASVTDVGFRSVCADFGAELCYTEMVSAKGLYYGSEKTKELLAFEDNHKLKAVQLFGDDADIMANVVESFGTQFDIIDINMGCPAPKIFKNNEGCALMGNIELARKIISACVEKSKVPITVKFRSGIDDKSINAIEFAKMCEEAGASAITLHARTREQFYSGKADLSLLKKVVQSVNIPVIGSGDVVDIASYNAMLETGVSAVMVGRGSLGNPAIFSILSGKNPPYSKFDAVKKHIEILRKYYSDDYLTKYLRKHFLWYVSGIENIKPVKVKLSMCDDLNDALQTLKQVLK
ncbi:MAG: tRNA dihydrouridine synthase DusB [Clostridia bacterium]|nr:tRNA dihydrouridine synthase DusB [Clostridia bacterium]